MTNTNSPPDLINSPLPGQSAKRFRHVWCRKADAIRAEAYPLIDRKRGEHGQCACNFCRLVDTAAALAQVKALSINEEMDYISAALKFLAQFEAGVDLRHKPKEQTSVPPSRVAGSDAGRSSGRSSDSGSRDLADGSADAAG